MQKPFNLLYPEWQGYASHQEVYHGARHFCKHVQVSVDHEVDVSLSQDLKVENGILGKSAILDMLSATQQQLTQAEPSHIFMIGGTCGCEIAPVSYLNKKYDGDLAIFWFDAHGDLNTPDTSPSQRFHGMPLRSLLGEGDPEIIAHVPRILRPEQVALVGARDIDEGEKEYIKSTNIPIFPIKNLLHTTELIDFAVGRGFTKAYIHFDLDVLDPVAFPHVLVGVAEGLLVEQALKALQLINQHLTIVGSSIVEFCPRSDEGATVVNQLVRDGMGVKF